MNNERWVAMNKNGDVYATDTKPRKTSGGETFVVSGGTVYIFNARFLFPDLTHENSPMKIRLEAE